MLIIAKFVLDRIFVELANQITYFNWESHQWYHTVKVFLVKLQIADNAIHKMYAQNVLKVSMLLQMEHVSSKDRKTIARKDVSCAI